MSGELEWIQERERFDWFARGLRLFAERYDVPQLGRMLEGQPQAPAYHEKVLVMLALGGAREAGPLIEAFASRAEGRLARFARVAGEVWRERGGSP